MWRWILADPPPLQRHFSKSPDLLRSNIFLVCRQKPVCFPVHCMWPWAHVEWSEHTAITDEENKTKIHLWYLTQWSIYLQDMATKHSYVDAEMWLKLRGYYNVQGEKNTESINTETNKRIKQKHCGLKALMFLSQLSIRKKHERLIWTFSFFFYNDKQVQNVRVRLWFSNKPFLRPERQSALYPTWNKRLFTHLYSR